MIFGYKGVVFMNKKLMGAFLSIFGGVCWGLSGSMGQYLFSYEGMDSKWLVPIRLFLAGVMLLVFSLLKHGKKTFSPFQTKKDALLTLAYGIPGVAFSQFLYFLCIQLSNAGIGTILQSTSPVPILIMTCILLRRKPLAKEIISIAMALCGVVLLVTHGDFSNLSVPVSSIIAGVGSAFCITLYNILGEPLLKKYPVEILQGWAFLLGGILMAFLFRPWSYHYAPTPMGLFGIGFVVVVGNVLAFTTYMSGVKLIGPVKSVLFEYSEPITAAIVTTGLFGNLFTWWDALGMVLIFFMLIGLSGKRDRYGD